VDGGISLHISKISATFWSLSLFFHFFKKYKSHKITF